MDDTEKSAPGTYVLYGVKGWGSVLSEAMLVLCGAPFRLEDVGGFDKPGAARDRLLAKNPLAQVPTLVLPGGAIMTESAAITLYLAETYPDAALAPLPGTAQRPAFLRRLIWLVANIYPTFTYGDYPERWVETAPESLRSATDRYRERLWRDFETEIGHGPWVLGEQLSALDLYVGVMSHWRPRRAWFAAHCPRLDAIAAKVAALPALAPVFHRNFTS